MDTEVVTCVIASDLGSSAVLQARRERGSGMSQVGSGGRETQKALR